MLVRTKRKEYYYDKFHRGFVNTCMIATVVAGAAAIYSGYLYYTRVLPQQKLMAQKAENELLKEGEDEENFVPA